MSPQRWQQVLEIAVGAFERSGAERAAFLDESCGADGELRRAVEAVLAADERAERLHEILPRPPGGLEDLAGEGEAPSSAGHGRFLPGAELGGRYRIVSVLGRGGMGDVVRADDLELGEGVALKFLPESLAGDPAALKRLRREVRLGRRVSHSNVCRVHDLGEADGLHFLSMELIDGEDLGSLLRRIGRLPPDRGVELAQELCAGLAAAHGEGVLHRDLKPANVMIDGRGRARITDFGVASLKEQALAGATLVGTPAYMAPELLAGEPPSVASDLYALGLVLFEVFTGRAAFAEDSLAGLMRHHRETPPERPSSLAEGLDGRVEDAILACLEKDPRRRPASALALAALLPGGDPLAAALAAGETPSPEMVAAAPDTAGLRPGAAAAMLALVVVGFGAILVLRERIDAHGSVRGAKSPAVLLDRAREVVRELGYGAAPAGEIAHGFSYDAAHRGHLASAEVPVGAGETAGEPIYFWYRQRPRPPTLDLFGDLGRLEDPYRQDAGTVRLRLDLEGRLRRFEAVPPRRADGDMAAEPRGEPWAELFTLAGLDPGRFELSGPDRNPPQPADRRVAWRTPAGRPPGERLTVEAATSDGKPVYFEVLGPWSTPAEEPQPAGVVLRLADNAAMFVYLSLLFSGAVVARRNLRLGRSDRRGAWRLAAVILGLEVLRWLLRLDHGMAAYPRGLRFVQALGMALYMTAVFTVYYLAFEPYVRRLWPRALVSWSRLLAGRPRDPLVGRDLLIGGVIGVAMVWLSGLGFLLPVWLGQTDRVVAVANLDALLGTPHALAQLMLLVRTALYMAFLHVFLLLLLRIVLRRPWLVAVLFVAVETMLHYGWFVRYYSRAAPTDWLLALLMAGCAAVLIMRFGLLATFAASLLLVEPSMFPVVTTDLSSWGAVSTAVAAVAVVALMAYAYVVSQGRRRLFRDALFED